MGRLGVRLLDPLRHAQLKAGPFFRWFWLSFGWVSGWVVGCGWVSLGVGIVPPTPQVVTERIYGFLLPATHTDRTHHSPTHPPTYTHPLIHPLTHTHTQTHSLMHTGHACSTAHTALIHLFLSPGCARDSAQITTPLFSGCVALSGRVGDC